MSSLLAALIRADHRGFLLLNRKLGHRELDPFFYLGGHLAVVPVVGLATAIYLLSDLSRSRLEHGAVLLVTLLVVWGLKKWVARRRPAGVLSARRPWGGGLPVSDASFPSGDTAQAAAIAVLLIRQGGWGPWVALYPVAVGLGRVYLGLHFPGDVFAGGLVGGLIAWLATLAL